MSMLYYLAADEPLDDLENPHEKVLSVNEAIHMGLYVPPEYMKEGIDREWKMIDWWDRTVCYFGDGRIEDGDFDDDFSIKAFEIYDDIYTEKEFTSEFFIHRWTEGRLAQVKDYLKWQLQYMDEVEFWHIFMGQGKLPVKRWCLPIDTLSMDHIQWLVRGDTMKHHYCLVLMK